MIDDPRQAAGGPAAQALVHLVHLVTQRPWALEQADLDRAHEGGLDPEAALQAVLLSAFFGYLNRMADAVGIELDYEVAVRPPPPDPATPPLAPPEQALWPAQDLPGALDIHARPAAAQALADWRTYALEREGALTRARRQRIAGVAAAAVGDLRGVREAALLPPPSDPLNSALVDLTETIAVAPWRLGAAALQPVREAGLGTDAAVLDAISTAAFANFDSRLRVALAALARQPRRTSPA